MAQLLDYLKDTPEVQEDDFVETFPYYENADELQEAMEYLLQLRYLLKEDDERLYELILNETDFRESLEFAEVGDYATFFNLVASDLELALYTNYLTKIYQAVREQQISSAIPDFAELPIVTQRLIQKMDAGILSQQALRMMDLALARLEPEISEALAENIESYLAFSDKENILEIINAMDEEELSQALDAMSDDDVALEAKERGVTRASICMERGAKIEGPVIFAIGNAPTALIRLYEMIQEKTVDPALIIGVPVGFVNVVESKELIMKAGVPYIVARGRKGGSNIAATICNALMYACRE